MSTTTHYLAITEFNKYLHRQKVLYALCACWSFLRDKLKCIVPYVRQPLASPILCLIMILASSAVHARALVLTLRPDSPQFHQVSQGIAEALSGYIRHTDMVVDANLDQTKIFNWIDANKPSAIVLMDNHGVNTYLTYQKRYLGRYFPPSIIVSTLSADRMVPLLYNSSAILYEVPAVTSLVSLRKMLVNHPVTTVGTLYRADFKQTFLTQKKFSALEQIDLVGIEVPNTVSRRALKKAIKKLKKLSPDAMWIMNDPALLTKDLLTKAWFPQLKRYDKPVVVGINTLINTQFPMGDYAAYPDHFELGIQVGDKLFDLQDNGWRLDTTDPVQPISISKEINIWRLRSKGIEYDSGLLNEFERVIVE